MSDQCNLSLVHLMNIGDDCLYITQVERGAAPALRISRKKGPPHVRDFVKEG